MPLASDHPLWCLTASETLSIDQCSHLYIDWYGTWWHHDLVIPNTQITDEIMSAFSTFLHIHLSCALMHMPHMNLIWQQTQNLSQHGHDHQSWCPACTCYAVFILRQKWSFAECQRWMLSGFIPFRVISSELSLYHPANHNIWSPSPLCQVPSAILSTQLYSSSNAVGTPHLDLWGEHLCQVKSQLCI